MNKCPRCKKELKGYSAISRRDGKTQICATCGTEEAIFDYIINRTVIDTEKKKFDIKQERAWLDNLEHPQTGDITPEQGKELLFECSKMTKQKAYDIVNCIGGICATEGEAKTAHRILLEAKKIREAKEMIKND